MAFAPVGSRLASVRFHNHTVEFERKLFVIRKQAHKKIWYPGEGDDGDSTGVFYITSFSSRLVCYKGMVLCTNLDSYYLDLSDERMVSAVALVHQRFSTNTFPSWKFPGILRVPFWNP